MPDEPNWPVRLANLRQDIEERMRYIVYYTRSTIRDLMETGKFDLKVRQFRSDVAEDLTSKIEQASLPDPIKNALLYVTEDDRAHRWRPIVTRLVGEMFSVDDKVARMAACSVESVHLCSLVLDDLPLFDNAETRRGKETLHIKYGYGVAIQAALWLLSSSHLSLTEADHFELALECRLVRQHRMRDLVDALHTGQYLDVSASSQGSISPLDISRLKSGRLFAWAAVLPYLFSDETATWLALLDSLGEHVGVAYQILDDIDDHIGVPHEMGKATKMDVKRPSTVNHLGIDGAMNAISVEMRHILFSLAKLSEAGFHTQSMLTFIQHMLYRQYLVLPE